MLRVLFEMGLVNCLGIVLSPGPIEMMSSPMEANSNKTAPSRKKSLIGNPDQCHLWEKKLGESGHVYRKTVKVYAKEAEADGVLETVVDDVIEARKNYTKGDYIMCSTRGGRFPMPRSEFHASYAHVDPEPSEDSSLADEGFLQYLTKGTKILALPISETDIEIYFPGGKVDGNILSGSGSSSIVLEAGDVIAMPFPEGGQVYPIKKTLFEKTYTIQDRATSHAEREAYENRTSLVRMMEKHATAVRNTLKSLGLSHVAVSTDASSSGLVKLYNELVSCQSNV